MGTKLADNAMISALSSITFEERVQRFRAVSQDGRGYLLVDFERDID